MKNKSSFTVVSILLICSLAAVLAVGCSSAPQTSSSSASASASSAAASEAASPESAEAASTQAAPSAASASASASAEAPSAATASESASASAEQTAPASSAASETAPASASADSTREAAKAAMDEGYQVFEGTVHVVDAEQLLALQDVDIDPAAASGGGEYAVLVFDQPIMVSGMSGDGSGATRRSATMMGVAEYTDYESFVVEYGNLDDWRDLDGQHATIAVLADDIMFPSDVRLPIGEPAASAVTIL